MSNSTQSSIELSGPELAAAALKLKRERHRTRLGAHRAKLDAWAKDFIGFAEQLDVVDKDGSRVPVRPSPMLAAYEKERTGWDIALKPRQVWFTTWELARDIHYFLTRPGARVLVICQSDKDDTAVRELSMRIRVMLGTDDTARANPERKLGLVGKNPWLGVRQKTESSWTFGEATLEVRGAGASKKAAEKCARSGTYHRVHITEISSFEFAISTFNAVEPTIPKSNPHAECVIESTPRGVGGLFYDLYMGAKKGANSFRAHFFNWLKHREYRMVLAVGERILATSPREIELVRRYGATAEQIKWYRQRVADKTQALTDQEFPIDEETCWLIEGKNFLDPEVTKLLLTRTTDPARIEPITSSVPDPTVKSQARIWKEPGFRRSYLIVADPSGGVVGGDPCAAAVFDRANGEHVASIHGLWKTHEFASVLEKYGRRYNNAELAVERINHGHAVLNALLHLGVAGPEQPPPGDPYPAVYRDPEDEQPGWKTGQVQRAAAMEAFENAHRTGSWRTPDRLVLAEMQRFVVNRQGKPEAAPGAHDDQVIVHVIGWTVLSRPRSAPPRTGKGDSRYHGDGADYGRGFY